MNMESLPTGILELVLPGRDEGSAFPDAERARAIAAIYGTCRSLRESAAKILALEGTSLAEVAAVPHWARPAMELALECSRKGDRKTRKRRASCARGGDGGYRDASAERSVRARVERVWDDLSKSRGSGSERRAIEDDADTESIAVDVPVSRGFDRFLASAGGGRGWHGPHRGGGRGGRSLDMQIWSLDARRPGAACDLLINLAAFVPGSDVYEHRRDPSLPGRDVMTRAVETPRAASRGFREILALCNLRNLADGASRLPTSHAGEWRDVYAECEATVALAAARAPRLRFHASVTSAGGRTTHGVTCYEAAAPRWTVDAPGLAAADCAERPRAWAADWRSAPPEVAVTVWGGPPGGKAIAELRWGMSRYGGRMYVRPPSPASVKGCADRRAALAAVDAASRRALEESATEAALVWSAARETLESVRNVLARLGPRRSASRAPS